MQRHSVRPLHALLLVAVLVVGCSAPDTAGSVAPSPSASTPPSASAQPSAQPSETPGPTSTPSGPADLAESWTVAGSFGDEVGIDAVHDVVEAPFGFLAGGVHLRGRALSVFGPLPQEGRIWSSADGSSWEDVTPADTFADASITDLVVLPDGSVVALTEKNVVVDDIPDTEFEAWSTTDGVTWFDIELAMPDGSPVRGLVDGGAGYLAYGADGLAHAVDGRAYHTVDPLAEGWSVNGLAAGPEGFVLLSGDTTVSEPAVVFASADGVAWVEATSPAWDVRTVESLGPDWIAVELGPIGDLSVDAVAATWLSPNGLDWTEAGTIPLRTVPAGPTETCREFVDAPVSTGDLIVVTTTLSYGCSEGNVVNFGTAHITADGTTWTALPFTERDSVDRETTRGTTVHAGLDTSAGTLLVGESDFRATFWFRPAD